MKNLIKLFVSIISIFLTGIIIQSITVECNSYIINTYSNSSTYKVKENFKIEISTEKIPEKKPLFEDIIETENNSKEQIKENFEINDKSNNNNNQSKDNLVNKNIATIFIGDSRTVGMSNSVKKLQNEFFIAKIGEGYSWLINDAVNEIDTIISNTNYDNYNLVFLLGVNDLGNYNKYIETYNYFKNVKYKNYNLYFCTVNPVIDGKSCATTKMVLEFNKKLENIININTYDVIINTFNAPDGLHYDSKTYKVIYNYIKESL
jgi:hypothetical protein